MLTYSLRGMVTGVGVGLASGYLVTGSHFEDEEWRTLVFSTGVGALSGLGIGLVLGIADGGHHRNRDEGPSVTHYVMRDMNYGLALGAVAGGAAGVLYWIEEASKDGAEGYVFTGAAVGALLGTAAGFVLGVVEKSMASDRDYAANRGRLALGVGFMRGSGSNLVPYPNVSGKF